MKDLEKNALSDDMLDDVVGGTSRRASNDKVVSNVMVLQCPGCKKQIRQIFYTDGSVKYKKCPNCDNSLGQG